MSTKIRVGIIGVGSISKVHIDSYLKNDNIELVAFCDINKQRLNEMMKNYNISKGYTDAEEMLKSENLDAVSVCTWNCAHAECSILALNYGVNVLCEKPMAMNTNEALKMKEAAIKNNKILMVGLVRRFGEDLQIIKDIVENKILGEIYLAKGKYLRRNGCPGGWFSDIEKSGGGPLIDLGVHTLDMMMYLLNSSIPISVYGFTFDNIGAQKNIKKTAGYKSSNQADNIYNVEDFAGAVIRFENNIIIQLEASYSLFIEDDTESIEIFGNKGGIQLGKNLKLSTNLNDYMANSIINIDTSFKFENAFQNEINHFIDCIKNNAQPIASMDIGITNMKILDAIYQSAKTGHEIQV